MHSHLHITYNSSITCVGKRGLSWGVELPTGAQRRSSCTRWYRGKATSRWWGPSPASPTFSCITHLLLFPPAYFCITHLLLAAPQPQTCSQVPPSHVTDSFQLDLATEDEHFGETSSNQTRESIFFEVRKEASQNTH